MDTSIKNLRRLIDSGTPENLEMAVQLTTNCTDEFQWLHSYCKAKLELPPQYPSWYALYSEVVKYCHGRVQVLESYPTLRPSPIGTSKVYEFYIPDVQQNVANEMHYMMSGVKSHEIVRDIETTSHALQYHYGRGTEEVKRNKTIELSNKLLRLIRKSF